ncbi:MAG: hypothetical protein ACK559_11190, partial [bacterium]
AAYRVGVGQLEGLELRVGLDGVPRHHGRDRQREVLVHGGEIDAPGRRPRGQGQFPKLLGVLPRRGHGRIARQAGAERERVAFAIGLAWFPSDIDPEVQPVARAKLVVAW